MGVGGVCAGGGGGWHRGHSRTQSSADQVQNIVYVD